MAFDFPTVNPAADRSSAESVPVELGTPQDSALPENGAQTASRTERTLPSQPAEPLDDGEIDEAQLQAWRDEHPDEADPAAEPQVGDNLPDGRSAYIKRENYAKLETELNSLRAELEATKNGGWNNVGQRLQRDGFDSPEAFLKAIEAQEQELAEQKQRTEVEKRVSALIDKEYAPELHKRMTDLEMIQERLMRRDRETTLKELPTKYPHADMATVKHFGTTPEAAEAIAKHTHSVMAAREEQHAKDIEIATKQAVLDYLASQKNSPKPPPENGGGRSVPSKATSEGYRPGRFGFAPRKTRV